MRIGIARSSTVMLLLATCLAISNSAAAQGQQPSNQSTAGIGADELPPNAAAPQDTGFSGSEQVASTQPPTQPEWFPLPADQKQHVDQLLDFWQKSSDQVHQCTCEFTLWEYDPTFCAYRNPQSQELAAHSVWRGMIRHASPDKALYETNEAWRFAITDDKPNLEKVEDENIKQKWICDGKYTYNYDFVNKKLIDMPIPSEFQGQGLVNSPLPFLFGADRQTLQSRFWIRPITPANAKDEYWLEAIPKQLADARIYSRVELVIARQDFLPKSMILFAPNYDPKEHPVSQAFVFENRTINGNLEAIKDFFGGFIRPKTPFGWERVEQKPFADDSITAQKEELERTRK